MNTLRLLPALAMLALVNLLGCSADSGGKFWPPIGAIDRRDPRFDKLIAPSTPVEHLATDFKWSEGPVWMSNGGYLLFSDIPRNTIWKWSESDGLREFMPKSGYTGEKERGGEPGSNGLALDAQGRLTLCEHGDRRVSRVEPGGSKVTLADKYEGKRLNSPNDLVFKSNGDLFFTDPPYGLVGQANSPDKELGFNGVYRLSKDGKLTLLTKDVTFPNGIGFSPDEKKLYVASSDKAKPIWMVYDVQEDGSIANGRVFFDATSLMNEGRKGLPDGLKVDVEGNVWATGPGGVLVFAPDGTLLGIIDCGGQPTANVGWGDDGSTLYITSNNNLLRVRTNTRGLVYRP